MEKIILNSNKDRKAYWKKMIAEYNPEILDQALRTLKPDTEKVLRLHYQQHHPLKDISAMVKLSITVIRNHHNRGIYLLYRYFNPRISHLA